MPTIGVYVPAGVSKAISERWDIDPDHALFEELIRAICAEALEDTAADAPVGVPFDAYCANLTIHKIGYRCRRCGGGR